LLPECFANLSNIGNDLAFEDLYQSLSEIFLQASMETFDLPPAQKPQKPKISNPTICLILSEHHRVNRMLSAICHQASLPAEWWTQCYLIAFSTLLGNIDLAQFLKNIWHSLNKFLYAEEKAEHTAQESQFVTSKICSILNGHSAKTLYPNNIFPLPLALFATGDSDLGQVVTGSDAVRRATIEYFCHLYHRTEQPPQAKPWLSSPSVVSTKV
jgi:hypothetical protein